ncbi:MAG: cation transporter [Verrucomicrobia bacterium]|nr:cation transporter [Verrucomicrobiota bacterium]
MTHQHDIHERGSRAISIALIVTVLFMLTQVIGGWIASSLALMADAAHLGIDAISFALALFAFWIAKRPRTSQMTYGYYRAEILGALTSGLLLWITCAFLIYAATRRFVDPQPVKGEVVFIIASITLIFNLVTLKILHPSSQESINVKAAYLHVIADLLGNIGVLLAGGLIWMTGYNIIDPLLTCLFTLMIFFSSGRVIFEAVQILMQGAPAHLNAEEVREALSQIPGVEGVHDLHLWVISSGNVVLSCHLIAKEADAVLSQAHDLLHHRFAIKHSTLQIEHPNRFESKFCYDTLKGSHP